jgi:hypothetical protein
MIQIYLALQESSLPQSITLMCQNHKTRQGKFHLQNGSQRHGHEQVKGIKLQT